MYTTIVHSYIRTLPDDRQYSNIIDWYRVKPDTTRIFSVKIINFCIEKIETQKKSPNGGIPMGINLGGEETPAARSEGDTYKMWNFGFGFVFDVI